MTPDELITRIGTQPDRTALILDFDGTLAPIVADPPAARMTVGVDEPLRVLAQCLGTVAIVSGRPAAFLGEHAAVPGVRLLGVYGTEEWRDDAPRPRNEALAWLPALDVARERLTTALVGNPGLLLEDKGLAVAVHWRNAHNRFGASAFVEQVVAGIVEETGLRQEPGKFVLELRPPLDWDKGTSVRAIVEEARPALTVFGGDDRGDLTAFAAVRDLGGVAVAVAHDSETPAEVLAAADVVVQGSAGMAAWLTRLAAAVAGP